MKTLVIYYSYTGKTKELVGKLAAQNELDILEVKETKRRFAFNAYVFGSLAARGQKQAELQPFDADFSAYDKIILAMPLWAGYPAPAMNNLISLLPSGKDVELLITSGSGNSSGSAEKTKALVAARGCRVTKYEDIKV